MRSATFLIAALIMLYVTFGALELFGMSFKEMHDFLESLNPF